MISVDLVKIRDAMQAVLIDYPVSFAGLLFFIAGTVRTAPETS